MTSLLHTKSAYEKVAIAPRECAELLAGSAETISIPQHPARDVEVMPNHMLPPRAGLQTSEGQARLLHDLANIELQAMELGIRTLREYPDAPIEFREQLAQITCDEARHLGMCLSGIEKLGFQWGAWPVHMNLWDSTSHQDSLIERIFIVHCYLEGSGLDSGDMILKKLSGVVNKTPREIVQIIADEEISHVKFGLTWFRKLAPTSQPLSYYLNKLKNKIPHRSAEISILTRQKAGFSQNEIDSLRSHQLR